MTHKRTAGSLLILALCGARPGPACAQTLLGDPADELQAALSAFDEAQRLPAGKRDRARQGFLEVADAMDSVAASGVDNGRLEYDIGNCYLQAGRLGKAILHYRRAQRLIPLDPLLADNLRKARSRRLTSIAPTARTSMLRAMLFLHYQTSARTRAQLAMFTYTLLWSVLLARLFVRRRALSAAAIACLTVSATLWISVGASRWTDRHVPDGVVTGMDVAVYNGPGPSYQRRFEQPLQPGVEFTLRSRRGAWWKIELPDGNLGWIDSATAALVPRGRR